jgi:hypothetical protein
MLGGHLLRGDEVQLVAGPRLRSFTGVRHRSIIVIEVPRGRRVPEAVGATLDLGLAPLQGAAVAPTVQTVIPHVLGPTNRLSPLAPPAKNRTSRTMLWQTIY